MNTPVLGSRVRQLATEALQVFDQIAGAKSAVLFSADGFEIASWGTDATMVARLAAIGSSLAALGDAICTEAGLSGFSRSTIEGLSGTVTIMGIGSRQQMALAVVADTRATLGQLLWATQRCSSVLARVLEQQPPAAAPG